MERLLRPPTSTESLFPPRLLDLASCPEQLAVKIQHPDPRSMTVLVIEQEYSEALTDPTAWQNWQESLSVIKKYRDFDTPAHPPPASVHPLHAELREQIGSGLLTTRDRVLLTYTIRIDPLRPKVLYVGGYNGERGVGIATDFYTQTLPKLAKKMDVRFITGSNNEENIDFFITKLGRVRLTDIKEEYQRDFFNSLSLYTGKLRHTLTVQFLYPEDMIVYLKDNP